MSAPSIVVYNDVPGFPEPCPFRPINGIGQQLFFSGSVSFHPSDPPRRFSLKKQIENVFTNTEAALTAIGQQIFLHNINEIVVIHLSNVKEKKIKKLIKKQLNPAKPTLRFLKSESFPLPIDVQIAMKAIIPHFPSLPPQFVIKTETHASDEDTLKNQIHDIFVTKIGLLNICNVLRLHLTVSSKLDYKVVHEAIESFFDEMEVPSKQRLFTRSIAFQKQKALVTMEVDILKKAS